MKISFGATYIKSVNVLKRENGSYSPKKVALVEIDPRNKNDYETLDALSESWVGGYIAFINPEMQDAIDNKRKAHVFGITSQEDSFEKLNNRKVLGVALFKENQKQNELSILQTNPEYIASVNRNAEYKHIGSTMLKFLKEYYPNKPMILCADDCAVNFYQKYGFKKTSLPEDNWRIWDPKKASKK